MSGGKGERVRQEWRQGRKGREEKGRKGREEKGMGREERNG